MHGLTGQVPAKLAFPDDNGPRQGFATSHVDREHTSAETVVRELLQNSLDAANGKACVEIHHVVVDIADIPWIDDYRQAFDQARAEWTNRGQGPPGENAVTRIERALASEKVNCLVCVDDGEGISPDALMSLYGTGATTKQEGGRGSVGQGHLTAFAFSDLRYVLYAGRATGSGQATFGGHAILATHVTGAGARRQQRSADGFIVEETTGQLRLWDDELSSCVHEIPSLLSAWLPEEGSGSAVMVTAFTPPGNGRAGNGREVVIESAAMNFVVAIADRELSVVFHDGESRVQLASASELESTLEGVKVRTSRAAHSLGPSGALAHRAWLAVQKGQEIDLPEEGFEGVRVWFRRLTEPDDPERGRVFVFRDGMWITERCSRLGSTASDFSGFEAFDAVVDFSSVGDGIRRFGTLVRRAEGASHYKVTPSEITESADRRELVGLLELLRDLLRQRAGKLLEERTHEPHRLARFGGDAPAPPRRPRPRRVLPDPDPDDEERDDLEPDFEDPVPTPPPDPDSEPGPPGPHPDPVPVPDEVPDGPPGPRPQRIPRPRRGQSDGIRTSAGLLRDDGTLEITWRAEKWRAGGAELRILIPPGTDEVSEQRADPTWLKIRQAQIVYPDGQLVTVAADAAEYCIRFDDPPSEGLAVVALKDPEQIDPLDAGLLRVDMVHRVRQSQPREGMAPE